MFIGIAIICGLTAIYLKVQLTYVASARTEWVRIKSFNSKGISKWHIESVDVMYPCDSKWQKFSGLITIQPPFEITIERISDGPMLIEIKNTSKQNNTGIVKLQSNEADTLNFAKECLVIRVNNLSQRARKGKTIVLPTNGYMEIGREVRHETHSKIPVLKSGKVQVIGKTIYGKDIYDAGTIALNIGDHFSVEDPKAGNCLVVADKQPGLSAVSYTLGKRAYVHRFGTEGYKIGSSLWVRIEKDPVIQALILAFFFILSALAGWRRWWKGSNGTKKTGE
jgi:hypothetical protein